MSATKGLPETEGDRFDMLDDLADRAGELIIVLGLACDRCCASE